jgi:hypothetical protein
LEDVLSLLLAGWRDLIIAKIRQHAACRNLKFSRKLPENTVSLHLVPFFIGPFVVKEKGLATLQAIFYLKI